MPAERQNIRIVTEVTAEGTDHDGEALSALRMANRMLRPPKNANGLSLEEMWSSAERSIELQALQHSG